jgi:cytochrome c551/c552
MAHVGLPRALLLAVAWLVLSSCGPPRLAATATPLVDTIEALQAELQALPPGDAASGQMVFAAVGCVACHSLQPNVKIVGPSLAGVATRAAGRRPGHSAALYLYESITRPNAYLVEGFSSGIMPQDFRQRLKAQQIADLVAFLLTLK